jgi:histidyl-tRNA synthetase
MRRIMGLEKCKGCRDLSPAEMTRFRAIEDVFRETTQKWGYQEVRTPTLEYLNLFTAAGTLTPGMLNRVYSFLDWDGWSGQRVVLRPDGTIPVARLYVDNPGKMASARYSYVVNTFIFEETGTEARERWQCAAELIGSNTAAANVELISLSLEVLSGLGIKGVEVRLAHAGIIQALLAGLEISHGEQDRIFDQLLDGDPEVLGRLKPEKPELVKTLALVLDMKGRSTGFLKNIAAIVADATQLDKPLQDFVATVELLEELGVNYQINLASGRGFEYYTGMIFHLFAGEINVGGGGRYDALISQMGGRETPAAGFALYMDQLIGLEQAAGTTAARVLVRFTRETAGVAFALAGQLRKNGFTAFFDTGDSGYTWILDVGTSKAGFVLTNMTSREKSVCHTPAAVLAQLGGSRVAEDSSA